MVPLNKSYIKWYSILISHNEYWAKKEITQTNFLLYFDNSTVTELPNNPLAYIL